MDILNQFGFDIKLFAAQIVNFLVIAFIFKKFLYKPILDTLNKRASTIKKGLHDAELATKALDDAETQKDEILKKAGKEAERILEEAKSQATIVRNEMMEETKIELALMMEQTKEQIQLEHENFKKDARNISLEISRQVLEVTIKNLFDNKEQDMLIKKGISKIKQHE